MSEFTHAMQFLQAKLPTAIQKCRNGSGYYLVGSIPIELTHVHRSAYYETHASNVYDTEQEIIDALLALGYTRFQLSDCSWYQVKG